MTNDSHRTNPEIGRRTFTHKLRFIDLFNIWLPTKHSSFHRNGNNCGMEAGALEGDQCASKIQTSTNDISSNEWDRWQWSREFDRNSFKRAIRAHNGVRGALKVKIPGLWLRRTDIDTFHILKAHQSSGSWVEMICFRNLALCRKKLMLCTRDRDYWLDIRIPAHRAFFWRERTTIFTKAKGGTVINEESD